MGDKLLTGFIYFILGLCGIACLYPFVYVLSSALSSGAAVTTGQVTLFPVDFNLESFEYVVSDKVFWTSYANTMFYTIVGTVYSMALSSTGSYALSRKKLRGRKFFNLIVVFTMWFNAGMIPTYLNFYNLGWIENNRWGIVCAFGIQAFNIVLLRNYFENVPESLEQAAMIDGANDFRIFWQIFMPLSKPALITVTLYYAIGRWNGFFWTMLLITDINKMPLQVWLRQKIIEKNALADDVANIIKMNDVMYNVDTIIYAIIVCSMIPVIIVYPYIQKYFTKGIMVGGVKE